MMVVKMEEGYDRVAASAYAWSHTAAPMLAGTLVTAVGFMPNGFARAPPRANTPATCSGSSGSR